jgi:uncharacterized protein
MPDRPSATDRSDRQEAADGGYFAPLAPARYMRLTTFGRNGIPVSATVHGLVVGDRAYFRARSQSGTDKCLRHTEAVQVAPCTLLGLSTWPPLDAIARALPAEEARWVATELDRRCLARHRISIPLPRRRRRRQAVYYELLADDAAGEQGELPEGLPAPLTIKVDASQGFLYADATTPTSLAPVCTPSKTHCRPADYTRIITVSMSLPARKPATQVQADAAAASAPAAGHIP